MADTKISALPAASALGGTETIPVVQGGATSKATVSQFTTAARAGLAQANITGLTTSDSPTFAGATIGTITGLVKGATGTLSAAVAGTDYIAGTARGAADGVASLDGSTLVPAAQLTAMVGDSGSGGTKGAVPAPGTGDAAGGKFLKADGVWTVPAYPVSSVAARTGAITLAQADISGLTTASTPSFAGTTLTGALNLAGDQDITVAGGLGWRDLVSEVIIKGTGAQDPTWGTFRNGLSGYLFSATAINETQHRFHIDHDYAVGTALYPHVHWSPITTGTGVVRWGFEYSLAKGHQQVSGSTFPATTTVYVEQTISTNSQYMHFVAEVSTPNAISDVNLEVDSVILMRVFRDASHVNDTYTGQAFAFMVDLHYQTARFATKNKAPNFYT